MGSLFTFLLNCIQSGMDDILEGGVSLYFWVFMLKRHFHFHLNYKKLNNYYG